MIKSEIKTYINMRYITYCLLLIAGSFLASCNKMQDDYQPFIKNGEILYTGRVDSLTARSGRNRIQLTWLLVSDPKITNCKVFWNNGNDSLLVPVKKTENTDTISVMLNNMAEGLYSFDVYTYDNAGHSSVKAEVTGTVYGDNYAGSIFNRALDSAESDTALKELRIKWFGIAQQAVVVDLDYTDSHGALKTRHITKVQPLSLSLPPVFLDTTIIPDYKAGTTFSYRTGYLPSATAIDTFYTDYREITPTLYIPPPPPPSGPADLALGTPVTASSSATQFLTDGDRGATNKWQPSSGDRADLNVWFYVDLGSSMNINTTQVYFTKDPSKITYYEVLYTTASSITTSTTWTRAFIKLSAPDAEDINTFNTVKARFVKVNIGVRDSGTNINVSELEVYNK